MLEGRSALSTFMHCHQNVQAGLTPKKKPHIYIQTTHTSPTMVQSPPQQLNGSSVGIHGIVGCRGSQYRFQTARTPIYVKPMTRVQSQPPSSQTTTTILGQPTVTPMPTYRNVSVTVSSAQPTYIQTITPAPTFTALPPPLPSAPAFIGQPLMSTIEVVKPTRVVSRTTVREIAPHQILGPVTTAARQKSPVYVQVPAQTMQATRPTSKKVRTVLFGTPVRSSALLSPIISPVRTQPEVGKHQIQGMSSAKTRVTLGGVTPGGVSYYKYTPVKIESQAEPDQNVHTSVLLSSPPVKEEHAISTPSERASPVYSDDRNVKKEASRSHSSTESAGPLISVKSTTKSGLKPLRERDMNVTAMDSSPKKISSGVDPPLKVVDGVGRVIRQRESKTSPLESQYRCDLCNTAYSDAWTLKRHCQTSVIHLARLNQKPKSYVCHLCDKVFYHQASLTRHLKHSNEHKSQLGSSSVASSPEIAMHVKGFEDLAELVLQNPPSPLTAEIMDDLQQELQRTKKLTKVHPSDHPIGFHPASLVVTQSLPPMDEPLNSRKRRQSFDDRISLANTYYCCICDHFSTTHREYHQHNRSESHMERLKADSFTCSRCSTVFKHKRNLQAHFKKAHVL